jgi:hypothetical protein
MPMTAPSARGRAIRPIAICHANTPACPRCGRHFPDTHVVGDGAAMLYCNRRQRKADGQRHNCGGRAFVVGLAGPFVAVVGITKDEWGALAGRKAAEILRGLGVLVEVLVHASEETSS